MQNTYAWKSLAKDVKDIIAACATCKLTKICERTAHGQYTSVQYSGPGIALGMDFYSMMASEDGMRAIRNNVQFARYPIRLRPQLPVASYKTGLT